MRWYEFECSTCKKVLNKKAFLYICNENQLKQECERCHRLAEIANIKRKYKDGSCVYLMYSESLNIYKIGATIKVSRRLSQVKREKYEAMDWVILDVFYTERMYIYAIEKIVQLRYINYKKNDTLTDYYEDIGFMSINNYFNEECRLALDFIMPQK